MSIKSQILHNIKQSLTESEEEHRLITSKMEEDASILNAFINLRKELDMIANRTSFNGALPVYGQEKLSQVEEEKRVARKRLGKKALEQLSLVEEMIIERFGLEQKQKSNKVRSPFGGSVDIGDDEVDDTFDRFDHEDDDDE
jgi:hypothetical protein